MWLIRTWRRPHASGPVAPREHAAAAILARLVPIRIQLSPFLVLVVSTLEQISSAQALLTICCSPSAAHHLFTICSPSVDATRLSSLLFPPCRFMSSQLSHIEGELYGIGALPPPSTIAALGSTFEKQERKRSRSPSLLHASHQVFSMCHTPISPLIKKPSAFHPLFYGRPLSSVRASPPCAVCSLRRLRSSRARWRSLPRRSSRRPPDST